KLSPFVEPVSRYFLEKGPTLDRPVIAEIARILRRELPAERLIYERMPPMFSIEDDLFPVDPEEEPEMTDYGFDSEGGRYRDNAARAKRPRLHGPIGGQDRDEEIPWKQPYMTPSEQ